jgi:hypothetical protein
LLFLFLYEQILSSQGVYAGDPSLRILQVTFRAWKSHFRTCFKQHSYPYISKTLFSSLSRWSQALRMQTALKQIVHNLASRTKSRCLHAWRLRWQQNYHGRLQFRRGRYRRASRKKREIFETWRAATMATEMRLQRLADVASFAQIIKNRRIKFVKRQVFGRWVTGVVEARCYVFLKFRRVSRAESAS